MLSDPKWRHEQIRTNVRALYESLNKPTPVAIPATSPKHASKIIKGLALPTCTDIYIPRRARSRMYGQRGRSRLNMRDMLYQVIFNQELIPSELHDCPLIVSSDLYPPDLQGRRGDRTYIALANICAYTHAILVYPQALIYIQKPGIHNI